MEKKEKSLIKQKFGLCLQGIIQDNKSAAEKQKLSGIQDHQSITSLRKLAAASGIEFSIIQKISAGKRNPELSTVVGIADGLGISLAELFSRYDNIATEEIKVESEKKKKKGNK